MKAKILINDLSGRFSEGEIGEVLENDFSEKYDFKIDLGVQEVSIPSDAAPFLRNLTHRRRIYYFYEDEIELMEEHSGLSRTRSAV